ncbi:TQXA domain-containing protein [Mycobacterium sp. CBMA271]|uniref:TQXA domain-containing protein n=1 Tax=unclassified Mycobacteroides TaxID=2618759 RepID=UPI0012DF380C|nr:MULTISPECIES: TQXA domain-containing protein [unclassified Mycobacteroides]MUM15463.1 TQXA domain-containing protein [Mycobacteroides sp. CBMA 326]MUM23552.1 TQXA domain-containing protein [Mycobacteroides sp. CBMA 271]
MTTHSLLALVEWPSARVTGRSRRRNTEVLPSRLTRYRGGTYSSTVDEVVFIDGTSARTDLIRLNPSIAAYSLDIAGIAPNLPSDYQVADWLSVANLRARTRETQAAWILANSYPALSTAELSRRLRETGYLGGANTVANIKDHEAIAGTQAAIWFLTNGIELDTAARNVPGATRKSPSFIEFEFGERPQLGGFVVRTAAAQGQAGVRLHASVDGAAWREVSSSELNFTEGETRYVKALGVGATVAETRHGASDLGYRFYRLYVQGGTDHVEDVDFWLHDARNHRNADRVVQLYRYLLEQSAIAAGHAQRPPVIDDSQAVMAAGLVGPFVLDSQRPVLLSLSAGATAMDISGSELAGTADPGTRFYVRPGERAAAVTVSVVDPDATAPVLTGVAEGPLTPLALVHPGAREVIEFTIEWAEAAELSRVS